MNQLVHKIQGTLSSAREHVWTLGKGFVATDKSDFVSQKRLDVITFFYLLTLFVVLVSLTWDMGLHADDYWNTFVAHVRDTGAYYEYFLENINSRYTMIGINAFFVKLFYKAGHPFDSTYIHAVKIGGLLAHFAACWLMYLCSKELKLPRIGILIAFPLMVLPTFGWEGFLWNSGVLAYAFGFLFFMFGVYAFCRRWTILFSISICLAIGATEYVMVPSFLLAIFLVYLKWRATRGKPLGMRIGLTALEVLLVLLPYLVWVFVSLTTGGMLSRTETINRKQDPLILRDQWEWIQLYFKKYSLGMQPYEWVREMWYVVPSIIGVSVIVAPGWRNRVTLLVMTAFYFAAIAPMAAVGYGFLNAELDGIILRSSRLFYFPGIFFCASLAFAVAMILVRAQMILKKVSFYRLTRMAAWAGVAVYISVVTAMYLHDVKVLAKGSEDAYACLRGFVETIYEATDGVPPKSVSECGLPPIVGHSPIFRGPYSGPHALSLRYGVTHKIPLARRRRCPPRMKLNFNHPECKYSAAYTIRK